MYSNMVFDIDGTMINTTHACIFSLQRLLQELTGKLYPPEELYFSMGLPSMETFAHFKLPRDEQLLLRWDSYYQELADTSRIFEGIQPLLERLQKGGTHLGIITSKDRRELTFEMARFDIAHYFDEIVCASDTAEHKPSPAPMLHYLQKMGARAQDTLYVGDTMNDSLCAKGAGTAFALALWGAMLPEGIVADYRLSTPAELFSLAVPAKKPL